MSEDVYFNIGTWELFSKLFIEKCPRHRYPPF